MKKTALLFFVSAVMPLSALCADAPSLPMMKSEVAALYGKGDWGICLTLTSFEKRDGQRSEVFAVPNYELEYSAKLTFVAPCYGQYDEKKKRFSVGPTIANSGFFKKSNKHFQVGETVEVEGKLHFVKKESGWNRQ